MPPRRITRRSVVSPSPALSDTGTPKPGKRGTLIPVEQVRNQTPTRFSLSYGSSLVAMPDRNKTAAGTDLETAFAEIHETVRTDNIKAEARRRELDARRGSTTPGPRRPDPIEEETEEEEEEDEEVQEEKEEDDDDNQGGYYNDEEEEEPEPDPPRRATKPAQTLNKLQDQIEKAKLLEKQRAEERAAEEREKAEKDAAERERKRVEKDKKDKEEREKREKAEREKKEQAAKAQQEAKAKAAREAQERAEREAKKRARDEEDQEQAELERAERNARLKRERSEDARRQAEQKHAAEAARKKEEQRQAREASEAEMASLEEAKRQAMRPPPPPSKQLLSTPPTSRTRELVVPDTGNSYVEESDVYTDSEKMREVLEEEVVRMAQQRRLARYTPEPPEPPRIARRPASTLSNSFQHAPHQVDQHQDLFDTEAKSMSDKQYPSFGKVSKPTAARPNQTSRPRAEQSNTTNGETPPPPYTTAPPTFMQRLLKLIRRSTWGVWKLFTFLVPVLLIGLIVLTASSYGSPDSNTSIRWYGWKHWRSNVGQFIPSHPQLTDDQFNDLKDFILEQSSSTESAVKNIQSLLPRMVHVKRGPNGDLIIQDDFWHALLDKMLKDSSVLTLDGTGDISEEHWDALRPRLIKAGLFEKGPSDEHILQIAEGTVSKSWERWVTKNGEKVAQVVKKHLPGDKGDGVTRDAAISRDEFVGLLKKRIAEHKEEIDGQLDSVKKGLETLIDTTVKAAISNSEGSLSKSEITTLVRNIVKKEIPRAQLEAAAKDGIMRNYHDYVETQVNHFGLGNEAGIVLSESSPVYRLDSQALPGNKHLSKLLGKPKPISSKDQVTLEAEYMLALSAWNDVGQCWCAGITASRGAELAVEMANHVIPQAIVVEHVHPNATNDPGSMPKDIEIWGYYPDADDSKRLLAWMDELYPGEREADMKRVDADNKKSLSLINRKYVKIGELEYDYAKTSGSHGMFVHKLSEELLDLDAATYKVLVRAKTNHGALDHTCIYRLKLFGEELEFEGEE
ncbi:hypothetical protein NEUTE1DRAFT_145389 [Neurospora tetrasperma FGSC 2508]|uniref:SUN domain-containing protein n=1 Tax=Neurospora tetrasperma (strain FGSC 2508 / ATCC MYA-4615 / P0657) TaxID=510951 RepID=F8MFY1_NEUT8|nr:uncharacterized protein NEUTE1DRAFT_145389 [Neurospora tetrasperma FGSC 2508]EGO59357.1 hypothetical protein NEUTE1DRAFT_145389 [Neurospora tetrasperma FGSC 2508]EGZ73477.1 hypothetical protein NEUTE2DRAFT_108096 [Neurospora tetrasperma FGSC 2509]